jgi:hypothetical protein
MKKGGAQFFLIVQFNLFVCFTKRGRNVFAQSNLHISGFAKQQKGGDCYT